MLQRLNGSAAKFLMAAGFFLIFTMAAEAGVAVITQTSTGKCFGGGTWVTHVYINGDNGKIMGSSGVDCDGNYWSRKGALIEEGGIENDGHITTMSMNGATLSVTADFNVRYQLLDMTTGNFVGSAVGPYPAGAPVQVDVSGVSGPYILIAVDPVTGEWVDHRTLYL